MPTKPKGMDVFILLDRTGSMASLWEEAVSSVNTYVTELKKDGANDRVTLAVFDLYDEGMQFDILRDAVPIAKWKGVSDKEVLPRGLTPLLDALMKLITMAEEVNNDKTTIVVMTDGEENSSREVSKEALKAAIDRIKGKKWQVNFLGVNFDGFSQAGGLGVDRAQAMNFAAGHADAAMAATARSHARYRLSKNVDSFLPADRQAAGEDQVGKKKTKKTKKK